MGYAYDHDCPFEAFITNLGKYNEGALVGEWVKFPTTAEELQKVFERIGIGSKDDFGHPYEEWFITDYDCYVDGLYEMMGEYENLDELNYLASKLEELDDHDYEHFQAAMQVSDYTGSVKDLINLIDNLDKYEIYPGVEDYSDLGHYYIDEVGVMEIPEHLANYIDYEAYGRDVAIDEMGQFTNYGYVRDAKYKLAAGKTAKSILVSCGARLAPFDIKELRDLTSYDELELDTLGDEKTGEILSQRKGEHSWRA